MVLIGLSCYLNRYASNWTKLQLKCLILDPNRGIFGNWPMGYWGGGPLPESSRCRQELHPKKNVLSLQTAAWNITKSMKYMGWLQRALFGCLQLKTKIIAKQDTQSSKIIVIGKSMVYEKKKCNFTLRYLVFF